MAKYKKWWSANDRLNKAGFTNKELRSLYRQFKDQFKVDSYYDFLVALANLDIVDLCTYFDFV